MGFFQQTPQFRHQDNPYLQPLESLQYAFSPARKYLKGVMKNGPDLGQFATDEASAYEQIRRTPRLQGGARANEVFMEQARNNIGGRRMAYDQDMRMRAASGLNDIFNNYNSFMLSKYTTLPEAYSRDIKDVTPQAGIGMGLVNSLISGGAQVGGAYAGRKNG